MSELNGKKVIFVGNSYIFFGHAVIPMGPNVLDQESRRGDKGYFSQLCRLGGDEVEVTNWTVGAHSLSDFLAESCPHEKCCEANHMALLKDRYYDYVVISGNRSKRTPRSAEQLLSEADALMNIFREANPNVKFYWLISCGIYNITINPTYPTGIIEAAGRLAERGVRILDWGRLVRDILTGEVSVPGATQSYNKNSFIVSANERDGFHPNELSGYITALFAYSAISGRSAVGQPYSFALDPDVYYRYDPATYVPRYYCYGDTRTNYPDILSSEPDVRGLQELVDRYLADPPALRPGAAEDFPVI